MEPTGPVYRPSYQLRSLPIRYRWEVTRRHPYYQDWWKWSRRFYRNEDQAEPAALLLQQAAVLILDAIGVSGQPPDPATSFEELEAEKLSHAWLSGAVHPITLRGLATLLVSVLPKETIAQVGLRFMEASCDDESDKLPRQVKAIHDLSRLVSPELDSFPDEPIVSINPAASGRQIAEAVDELQKTWKDQRDLGEQRDRSGKYDQYLRVWDLREGWTGAAYDRDREATLREIAATLKLSISTVESHYFSAFELVVGHPYTPELWCRVFAALKLSELAGEGTGRTSASRPISSRTRRDVPDSVVSPNNQDGLGVVASEAQCSSDTQAVGLMIDIRNLIGDGLTDDQIQQQLELSNNALPAIAYLRQHGDEPIRGPSQN